MGMLCRLEEEKFVHRKEIREEDIVVCTQGGFLMWMQCRLQRLAVCVQGGSADIGARISPNSRRGNSTEEGGAVFAQIRWI